MQGQRVNSSSFFIPPSTFPYKLQPPGPPPPFRNARTEAEHKKQLSDLEARLSRSRQEVEEARTASEKAEVAKAKAESLLTSAQGRTGWVLSTGLTQCNVCRAFVDHFYRQARVYPHG